VICQRSFYLQDQKVILFHEHLLIRKTFAVSPVHLTHRVYSHVGSDLQFLVDFPEVVFADSFVEEVEAMSAASMLVVLVVMVLVLALSGVESPFPAACGSAPDRSTACAHSARQSSFDLEDCATCI
jgi:hypothetical protein